MKNPIVIIALVVGIIIAVYFLVIKKKDTPVSIATTTTKETGISALFGPNGFASLLSNLGKNKDADKPAALTATQEAALKNQKDALSAVGFGF